MASPKVVRLNTVQKRTANSAVSLADLDTDEVQFLSDLRGLVWKEGGTKHNSWKDLGEKARLNPKTIQRFASGETRRPQIYTVRRICQAVDWVMTMKPKGKQ